MHAQCRPAWSPLRRSIRVPFWTTRIFGLDIHPFDRVLNPAQVACVAIDLAQADIRKLYQDCLAQHSPDWAAIMDGRRDRVEQCVAEAAYFTAKLAARRMGLIYSIG